MEKAKLGYFQIEILQSMRINFFLRNDNSFFAITIILHIRRYTDSFVSCLLADSATLEREINWGVTNNESCFVSGGHARFDITRINSGPENRYGSIYFTLCMWLYVLFFMGGFCIRCTRSEFLKVVWFWAIFHVLWTRRATSSLPKIVALFKSREIYVWFIFSCLIWNVIDLMGFSRWFIEYVISVEFVSLKIRLVLFLSDAIMIWL